jgi:hypothetical protein
VVAVRSLHVEELAEVLATLAFDFNAEGAPQLDGDWRREN